MLKNDRSWTRSGAFLIAVFLLAFGADTVALGASRHPGPSVWADIKFDLDKGVMLLVVEGAAGPLATNLDCDILLIGPLAAADEQRARAHILREFTDGYEIQIDGARVLPELSDLRIQDGVEEEKSFKSAVITLAYPCPALPRSISVTWERFEGEGIEFIPIVIHLPDAIPDLFSVWPDDPRYIWHAEDVRPRERRVVTDLRTDSGGRIPVPVPSVMFVFGGLVLLLVGRTESLRRVMIPIALGMFVGAGLARDRGQVDVRVPWKTKVPLPSPPQALAIFQALHTNIYAAFDAKTEDGIYDLLAASVDLEILDDLYGEVYESLILREQGGAICEIEQVEKVDGTVSEASYTAAEEATFTVDWRWNVYGIVSHYGHIHRRMNQYEADYTVRHDGIGWKISTVTVRKHERVEEFE